VVVAPYGTHDPEESGAAPAMRCTSPRTKLRKLQSPYPLRRRHRAAELIVTNLFEISAMAKGARAR